MQKMQKKLKIFAALPLMFALVLTAVLAAVLTLADSNTAEAAQPPPVDAASYVLMSADTGEILAEENADAARFPASTTKLMTMVLIMEALENGSLTLDDQITTSEFASGMGGSQVYLEAGETRSLKEMLIGIAVGSGNDACVAVAEHMAGSEEAFVDMMNGKAKEIGMKGTHFVNAHGLHDEKHYTTAADMAALAYYALQNYPQLLEYTSIYEYQFRPEPKPLVLWNTNKLLKWYEGTDGLKTGYTSNAGRNLVATASRNDMRLISVVMGVQPKNGHFKESIKLLDYGFNNYTYDKIFAKGDVVCSVPVEKGTASYVDLMTANDVGILTEKNQNSETERSIAVSDNIQAPVQAGDVLGQITISRGGEDISAVDLIAITDVPKISLPQMFLRNLQAVLSIG